VNIDQIFHQGDYVTAALEGSPDQWAYHAARGFLGRPREAIEALETFDHEEARFYSGVLSWFDGDEDTAIRVLETVAGDHARNLVALIRKPTIQILSQLPWSKGGPTILLEGADADPKFKIQNIGFGENDLPNRPFADIHSFYTKETKPDFFVCNMVEWHQIPPNLLELDCPLIGQTSDFDVHIQAIYPWLRLFDHIMVCDHAVEYDAVRAMTERPVHTFIKTFGHPFGMPKPRRRERDLDVFVSGSLFAPYHPEKAEQIHQILRQPDLSTLLVNGHISADDYLGFVSRAKVTPCYCRHWGGALTRAMESASLGSATLVQEGSAHTLWADEEQGLLTYPESDGVAPSIKKVLANYDRLEDQIYDNIDTVRAQFDPKTVASQYFRFCTFLAAQPRRDRDMSRATHLTQKRVVLVRGWVPADGDLRVLSEICSGNVAQLRRYADQSDDPRFLNDMAREYVLLYCNRILEPNVLHQPTAELEHAIEIFRDAVGRFPNHLVLKFNLIRILIHFGDLSEIAEGYEMAAALIRRAREEWDIGPLDDVMPYDFCSTFFNYRVYLDLVVDLLAHRTENTDGLVDLIYASVNHYLGRHLRDPNVTGAAVELDPDFPFYTLSHAVNLLSTGAMEDAATAQPLLLNLAENSMVGVQAHWLLRRIEALGGARIPAVAALDGAMARAEECTFLTEAHYPKMRTPYYLAQRNRLDGKTDYALWKRNNPINPVDVSVVLIDRGASQAAFRLDSLIKQDAPRTSYEIIFVELSELAPPDVAAKVDTLLTCGQTDFLFHANIGFNVGLVEAKGNVVVFSDANADFPENFISSIRRTISPVQGRPTPSVFMIDAPAGHKEGQPRSPWRALACPRELAIEVHGFDQHEYFHGRYGGLDEFAWRLQVAGARAIVRHGDQNLDRASIPFWGDLHKAGHPQSAQSAARQMWPRLFNQRRKLPLLPHLIVANFATHGTSSVLVQENWWLRQIYRTARAVHLASGAFMEEFDKTHRLGAALHRVTFLISRAFVRRYLPASGYRRLSSWYRKRYR
jgi:hypothetical protein